MLNKFKAAKEKEIQELLKQEKRQGLPPIYQGNRPDFKANLKSRPASIIAEFKPGSPSRGRISNTPAPVMGKIYKQAGASCISVLTEKEYFGSRLENLKALQGLGLPLLRKDFILHPLQLVQTAATPASAVLLICRYFQDQPDLLAKLCQTAQKFGLAPVLEIFDFKDLKLARSAKAEIIQVNNRNLNTLEVDLNISRQLIRQKKENELWISASGIKDRETIQELFSLGFQSFLIGTQLMLSQNPEEELKKLLGKGIYHAN